jgi:hypothetical protein
VWQVRDRRRQEAARGKLLARAPICRIDVTPHVDLAVFRDEAGGLAFAVASHQTVGMGRVVAGSSAATVFAAWIFCVERYVWVGSGGYNDGIFIPLLLLAITISGAAGRAAFLTWRGAANAVVAATIAVAATVVVVALALAIGLRG